MKPGLLITLEGTEGVGKSTNLQFIRDTLSEQKIPFICTREPGGTPLAETLRELLLAPRDEPFDPLAELLIMFAARAQHIAHVIRPALERGLWVICDRFTDATFAYQGGGRGVPMNIIAQLEALVQRELRPDAVILLDISPQLGLERAGQRAAPDRFERERCEFFERVRSVYLERADADPARYYRVDASRPLVDVQQELKDILARIRARHEGEEAIG
ncbi:Thymidylate kinase [gamma proteobacterium HdN1]|nr:Thymidylate kinase [gamma proteobacterium HdN1]